MIVIDHLALDYSHYRDELGEPPWFLFSFPHVTHEYELIQGLRMLAGIVMGVDNSKGKEGPDKQKLLRPSGLDIRVLWLWLFTLRFYREGVRMYQ